MMNIPFFFFRIISYIQFQVISLEINKNDVECPLQTLKVPEVTWGVEDCPQKKVSRNYE